MKSLDSFSGLRGSFDSLPTELKDEYKKALEEGYTGYIYADETNWGEEYIIVRSYELTSVYTYCIDVDMKAYFIATTSVDNEFAKEAMEQLRKSTKVKVLEVNRNNKYFQCKVQSKDCPLCEVYKAFGAIAEFPDTPVASNLRCRSYLHNSYEIEASFLQVWRKIDNE